MALMARWTSKLEVIIDTEKQKFHIQQRKKNCDRTGSPLFYIQKGKKDKDNLGNFYKM